MLNAWGKTDNFLWRLGGGIGLAARRRNHEGGTRYASAVGLKPTGRRLYTCVSGGIRDSLAGGKAGNESRPKPPQKR